MSALPAISPVLAAALAHGVTEDAVLALRRAVYSDGGLSRDDADLLCDVLANAGDGACPHWPAFFAEAMADHLLNGEAPAGFVAEDRAAWFLARIAPAGHVETRTAFEALLHVMDGARRVPERFIMMALDTVKDAVLRGRGPLAAAGRVPGIVTAADVAALRRILFAATGEGFGHVTRPEAEALFDIAEATVGHTAGSGFDDFFARAVGNHLLSTGGAHVADIAEAMRRERWLDQRQSIAGGVGDFFSRALTAVVSGDAFSGEGWMARQTAETVLRERVDEQEALWLVARIGRDGVISDAEQRLLAFLRVESPDSLPDALKPLLRRA